MLHVKISPILVNCLFFKDGYNWHGTCIIYNVVQSDISSS
jgi:hypothetical protein